MTTRWFGVTVAIVLWVGAFPEAARAQGFGYALTGPMASFSVGGTTTAWNAGGGGEAWVGKNASVGGELGYIYSPPFETSGPRYSLRTPSIGAPLLSLNGSRHFRRAHNRLGWQPFVTGGISVFLGREPASITSSFCLPELLPANLKSAPVRARDRTCGRARVSKWCRVSARLSRIAQNEKGGSRRTRLHRSRRYLSPRALRTPRFLLRDPLVPNP
jgi:hypothetical protein